MTNAIKALAIQIARASMWVFWMLHKPLVLRNEKLKGLHKNDTCFIFANGASLKFYDISKLPNNPAIVCAFSLIDKRMSFLNVQYYVTTDSYSLYSILYNTYPLVRKFQWNQVRKIYSDIFKQNKHLKTFVNITNLYSSICRRDNIHYYHYFEDKESFNHDLSGSFSNCRAALDTMLGVAKYLGFSRAVLIGCDYLGTPPVMGHLYSDSKPFSPDPPGVDDLADYRARVKIAAEGINVTVILPDGVTCPDFEFDSYESYFSLKKEYRENKEFIDMRHLIMLRDAAEANQAYM